MDINEKSKIIIERIKSSKKILVVPDSGRIDYDCLASALAVKYWIEKLGDSEVKAYIFTGLSDDFDNIPNFNLIQSKYIREVDFNYYDLIILVDASDWDRVLTQKYQTVLDQVDINKFINIDHHDVDRIEKNLPEENNIRVQDSSTTKVIYDHLIEPSGITLDKELAEYLYYGLVDDTQCFNVMMYPTTFTFAQKLVDAGADHYRIVEEFYSIRKEAIDLMVLAASKTKYYPEIKTTMLIIDEELAKEFGEISKDWIEFDMIEYYKKTIMRRPKGYDYSIIFKIDRDKGTIKANWRSRNRDDIIWIIRILEKMGFVGGGHRGAGSARTLEPRTLANIERHFIEEMTKEMGLTDLQT